jgi:hypothetical protein
LTGDRLGEAGMQSIDNDEAVYRRIPVKQNYYKPENGYLSAAAFRPTPRDLTGISLSRAKLLNGPEAAAALGYEGELYWVVELRVGDVLGKTATVVADDENNPSHAIIPEIRAENMKSRQADELMDALSRLPRVVHGPFPGKMPKPVR